MHPNPKFHIRDREEMAALVRRIGFGALVARTEAGLRAVHVPVLLRDERLLFHISRHNAVHAALAAGGEALFLCEGPHAYVSPDWYGLDDRVPTWSYVAVEVNGPVRPLDRAALVGLLDAMSSEQEARLAPKPPWTREAMRADLLAGLLDAISGFEMVIAEWRGTAKIDQDKAAEARGRVATALAEQGEAEMAALYASPASRGGAG